MIDDLSDEEVSDDNSSKVAGKKRKTPSKESRLKKKRKTVQEEVELSSDFSSDLDTTKIQPYLDAYRNNILTAEQLIEELSKFKSQFQGIKFLLLVTPPSVFNSMLKAKPQEDVFFQWLLDELEVCVEDLPNHKADAPYLLSRLCIDEACLTAMLQRPEVRATIYTHFAIPLIGHFFHLKKIKADPFVFLNAHFSAEVIERVKVEPLFTTFLGTRVTFLEMLSPAYMEYIPNLWSKGFRASNAPVFNQKYFEEDSKHVSDEIRKQAYNTIASQDECSDLLVFAEDANPMAYFLANKVIDLDLFKRLLKKSNATPDINVIMDCFKDEVYLKRYTTKLSYYINFIEKIIYSISLLPNNVLQAPAQSSFLARFNTRLMEGFYKKNPQTVSELNNLLPQPTLAEEILFYCADAITLKANGKYRAHLKKLVQFLSDESVSQLNLSKILYYTFLTQMLQGTKAQSPLGLKLFLTELFGKQLQEMTTDEKDNLVSSCVIFISIYTLARYSKIVQEKKGPQNGSALQLKVDLFASSLGELIAATPKIQLIPVLYYYLSLLLFVHIALSDPSDYELLETTIRNFVSHFDVGDARETRACLLAYTLAGLAQVNKLNSQLMDRVTKMEPSWINYLANSRKPNGQEYNVLSSLFNLIAHKNKEVAEKNAQLIVHFLEKIGDGASFTYPTAFLYEVAERYLNLQKRAQLSEPVQKLLEQIYNLCIHRVQGTEQEKAFEEMRTQLLLKHDVDPTKDAQAIHTAENHTFADKIYDTWVQALGETEQERGQKLVQGYKAFTDYLAEQKNMLVRRLVTPNQASSQLADYIYFLSGDKSTILSSEFQELQRQVATFDAVSKYLKDIAIRFKTPVTPETSPQIKKAIADARKLMNLICMMTYYSIVAQAPSPFAIHDEKEALHILFTEIIDQVENPSCDQGPFIRLLIALEPVAEFKFPYLTRRNVQFYVKEYINNYYEQLSQEAKNQLVLELYNQIEDKEILDEIDSIPENAFSFLGQKFLEENTGRLGFISVKEIESLFFLERPAQYHPKIVEALNQHHHEQKNKVKLSANAYDLFGLFRNNNNDKDGDGKNVDLAHSI